MQEIKRVLIHPHSFFKSDHIGRVWADWENKSDTFLIASGNYQGLWNSSLLDNPNRYLVRDSLTIGGQETHRCIWIYLDTIARHARIQNREIQLNIDSRAVVPAKDKFINETIRRIYESWAVVINCI